MCLTETLFQRIGAYVVPCIVHRVVHHTVHHIVRRRGSALRTVRVGVLRHAACACVCFPSPGPAADRSVSFDDIAVASKLPRNQVCAAACSAPSPSDLSPARSLSWRLARALPREPHRNLAQTLTPSLALA